MPPSRRSRTCPSSRPASSPRVSKDSTTRPSPSRARACATSPASPRATPTCGRRSSSATHRRSGRCSSCTGPVQVRLHTPTSSPQLRGDRRNSGVNTFDYGVSTILPKTSPPSRRQVRPSTPSTRPGRSPHRSGPPDNLRPRTGCRGSKGGGTPACYRRAKGAGRLARTRGPPQHGRHITSFTDTLGFTRRSIAERNEPPARKCPHPRSSPAARSPPELAHRARLTLHPSRAAPMRRAEAPTTCTSPSPTRHCPPTPETAPGPRRPHPARHQRSGPAHPRPPPQHTSEPPGPPPANPVPLSAEHSGAQPRRSSAQHSSAGPGPGTPTRARPQLLSPQRRADRWPPYTGHARIAAPVRPWRGAPAGCASR